MSEENKPDQPTTESVPATDVHNGDCHDYLIARGVVIFLGLTGVTVAIGSIIASCLGVKISSETMGLGMTALGALSALLSKTSK